MKATVWKDAEKPIYFVMLLAFLSAPYFYIRQGGFDFSKGTSFSLVDCFLVGLLLLVAKKALQNRSLLTIDKQCRDMLFAGSIFTVLCLLSGVVPSLFYDVKIHWPSLLSGTVQYAFIFVGFPLLASFFLSTDNIRTAIRFIALGYLPPMLITILLLPADAIVPLREMFYFANRALGTYGNAVSFAVVLLVTLPFYIYLIATEKGFWQKIGYIGTISLLCCLFLTASFSGIIVLSLVVFFNFLLAIFWKNNPLRRNIKDIAVLFTLVISLFVCSYVALSYYSPVMVQKVEERIFPKTVNRKPLDDWKKNTDKLLSDTSKKAGVHKIQELVQSSVMVQSANTRMELNYEALKLIKERNGGLFFGHGLRQTRLMQEFNIAGNGLDIHCVYLLLWVEGGLILTLVYVGYFLLLLRNCIKLSKAHPNEALALGTSLLALALFCLFLPHTYLRYFWIPLLPTFVTIKDTLLRKSAEY